MMNRERDRDHLLSESCMHLRVTRISSIQGVKNKLFLIESKNAVCDMYAMPRLMMSGQWTRRRRDREGEKWHYFSTVVFQLRYIF